MTTPTSNPNLAAPAPAAAERRRDSLFLLARVKVGRGGTEREVRVRNLSEGGLMAEHDGAVTIGDPVVLELRGVGSVTGQVAWAELGRIGVSFDRPIDPKLARKPVGGGTMTPGYAKAPPRR